MERDTNEALDLFEKELASLINKHNMESMSDTPDFVLAHYLRNCLEAYNKSQRQRQEWYGRPIEDCTCLTGCVNKGEGKR